ncbi:MAG: hypothetical protein IJP86_11020 [Synergistaceae bacterium]|nr:hypothetical protein [Synergistaceae bacterium]
MYSFTVMEGSWAASNGSATKTEINSGETIYLTMIEGVSGFSFSDIQVDGDTAVCSWSGRIFWSDGNSQGPSSKPKEFQHVSGNTWKHENSSGEGHTLTITSPTTVEVEEELKFEFKEEGKTYRQTAHYTLTKQASQSTPDTPATATLNGTWRITGGTLSGSGISANYVRSSAETFTLALSDAGDGDYVLSVSGEGVSKKESTPYVKAYFEGIDDEVRVVWGTSTGARDGLSTCVLSGPNTYSLSYQFSIHDVNTVSYQLVNASTIRYTQSDPSIHDGNDAVVDVALTLERVN